MAQIVGGFFGTTRERLSETMPPRVHDCRNT
jgi:hypothetical protein